MKMPASSFNRNSMQANFIWIDSLLWYLQGHPKIHSMKKIKILLLLLLISFAVFQSCDDNPFGEPCQTWFPCLEGTWTVTTPTDTASSSITFNPDSFGITTGPALTAYVSVVPMNDFAYSVDQNDSTLTLTFASSVGFSIREYKVQSVFERQIIFEQDLTPFGGPFNSYTLSK